MSVTMRVFRYGARNMLRNGWLLGYTLLFLLVTSVLLRLEGGSVRVAASLMNVVLLVIPLVSVVFGTLYFSNSREFIELLLAQPVGRPALYRGLYFGLALPLALAFVAGVGVPMAIAGDARLLAPGAMLLLSGVLLTFVFTSVAFLAGVKFEDRARGLGFALLVWAACALLYDGLVMLVVLLFRDHPLETPLLVLMLLNPVDLARVLMLLTLDAAALMGYTGAVFARYFGTVPGMVTAGVALLAWMVGPFVMGMRGFGRRDF